MIEENHDEEGREGQDLPQDPGAQSPEGQTAEDGEGDDGTGADMEQVIRIKGMYNEYFLDYASYVILERAVPHLHDGLKPVQRRILHSLKEMDDGRFHKVANAIGNTMKYHPHGDASIGDAYLSSSGCIKAEPKFGVFESLCGHFGSKASFASVIKTPKVDLRSFRGFTLEAYVMFTDSPSNQYIFGHGKGSKRSGLHIGVRPGKGIYFGFYGDDLNYDFTPSLDVWYHLVFTYENSGSFTKCIYVDGVLKKSGSGGKYAYSGSNKQ